MLVLLIILISDCLCLAHIPRRNQDEFTVSFISRQNLSSFFFRMLFEFRAHVNSLDHLDCSHGVLAVFHKINLFQEANFSLSMKAVVRICACATSLDHLDFKIVKIDKDEFTVSFKSRLKFIFLFFNEAVRTWSFSKFS